MNNIRLISFFLITIGLGFPLTQLQADNATTFKQLNFVVALPAPPSRIFKVWSPTVQYLQSSTGYKINLLTPKGLDNIDQMLASNEVDFIYINSYAYYRYHEKGLLDAITQMRNKSGQITSRGRVLVRKDSGLKSITDIEGGTISLISPNGAGSYLAPKAFFRDRGLELEKDIKVSYSGDLKKSVYDVLLKDASAAVMCGVNYEIINKKIDMNDIFVIDLTDEFPEAVIAVRTGLSPQIKSILSDTIISMSESYGGRKALMKLRNTKIHDFIPYDPSVEKQTRSLIDRSGL